ncbi:MAG: FkbM family methyltransferase [Alphaproteobacteria bacterium]
MSAPTRCSPPAYAGRNPGTVADLSHNIALNALGDRVTVHEIALGDVAGEVMFTIGLDTTNQVTTKDDVRARVVRQERLDNITEDTHPAMIKVDVEGYEETFFGGAAGTLKDPGLRVVELELLTPKLRSILESLGFERAYYDPFRRHLAHQPVDIPASNALYIRDWDFVQARVAESRAITIHGRTV